MLGFRVTNERGVFAAVVVFPLGQFLFALTIAHGVQIFCGHAFGVAVAQRVQRDGVGSARQGIAIFGTCKHWSLVVQPDEIAEEDEEQQSASTRGDPYLGAIGLHPKESLARWAATARLRR